MEDPALNRRIEETRELSTRWGQFRDFLNMATKGEKVTPEAESKFLELKTRIAMLHDGFMHSLKHDHKVGQQVLGIISACIMLRRVPLMSGAELQKLELDWNEAYLLMTETIANLEEERHQLASINMRAYKMNQAKQIALAHLNNIMVNPLFRLGFFVFFIAFVLWGVPALGIYNWLDLRTAVPFTAKPINKGIDWWRAHVNAEFPYDTLADVPVDPIFMPEGARVQTDVPVTVNADYVVNQLFNLGFSKKGEEVERARGLLGGKIDFRREVLNSTRTSGRMLGFYFLFKNTNEARQFIDLRQANMTTLTPDERGKIQHAVRFGRKANFVGIIISEDQTFKDYLQRRYLLTPEQIIE